MKNIERGILGAVIIVLISYALSLMSGEVPCFLCDSDVGSISVVKDNGTSTITSVSSLTVKRVIDGDTIELSNGDKVRYIGIDTPESVDPRRPVECFGKEAKAKNSSLVLGREVRLEKDVSDKDKYDRLLRYVYVGDTFVNLELVKLGYANAASYPPDVKYQSFFRDAEREAREAGRGLWSMCE